MTMLNMADIDCLFMRKAVKCMSSAECRVHLVVVDRVLWCVHVASWQNGIRYRDENVVVSFQGRRHRGGRHGRPTF